MWGSSRVCDEDGFAQSSIRRKKHLLYSDSYRRPSITCIEMLSSASRADHEGHR